MIFRFRKVDEEPAEGLRMVAEFWRPRPGCLGVDLVVNLDEPGLRALMSGWRDVGGYRRTFSGNKTRLLLTPVLLRTVDKPPIYLDPGELAGDNGPWLGGS